MAAEVAGQTCADALIADQIAYYRARAGEYDQSMLELGRYISMPSLRRSKGAVALRPSSSWRAAPAGGRSGSLNMHNM